eukprot:m.129734 g.129734  ORF g.129734 m.129734 type:complete len:114 (-) comp13684_c0_seq3:3654-3995(-)
MSSPSASAEALPGHGFPAMSTDGQPRESPMDVEAKGSSTEVAPEEAKSDDMELDEKVDPENEEAPSDDEAEVEEANESDDDGYYAEVCTFMNVHSSHPLLLPGTFSKLNLVEF